MVMPLLANRTTVRSVRFSAIANGATSKHQRAVSSGLGLESVLPSAAHLFGAGASDDTSGDQAHTQSGGGASRTASAICAPAKAADTAPFLAHQSS